MGKHIQDNIFRVADITVQLSDGSHACFTRNLDEHTAQLSDFFERTGKDYKRYNYLGEWHSHPSFIPLPSETDFQTMQSIVSDPQVGANFLVLMIVRLSRKRIEVSAHSFTRNATPKKVELIVEPVIESTNLKNLFFS